MFNKKLSSYAAVTGHRMLFKLSRTYAGKYLVPTETEVGMIRIYPPQIVTGVLGRI